MCGQIGKLIDMTLCRAAFAVFSPETTFSGKEHNRRGRLGRIMQLRAQHPVEQSNQMIAQSCHIELRATTWNKANSP